MKKILFLVITGLLLNLALAACNGQPDRPAPTPAGQTTPTPGGLDLPPPSTPDQRGAPASTAQDDPAWLTAPPSQVTPPTVPALPPETPTPTVAAGPALNGPPNGQTLDLAALPALAANPAGARLLARFSGQNRTADGKPEPLRGAALSPDRKLLALSDRTAIWIIELASGKTAQTLQASSAGSSDLGANSLAWSGDGSLLAAGGLSGTITMWRWDRSNNAFRKGPARLAPSAAAESFGDTVEVAFSPDSKWLAGFGSDGHLTIYDTGTQQISRSFTSDFAGYMSWSPDSKRLADEFLNLHYMDSGASLEPGEEIAAGSDGPQGVAWSPDGKWLAVSGNGFELLLEEAPVPEPNLTNPAASQKPLRVPVRANSAKSTSLPHLKEGRRVAWSPGSKLVAAANVPDPGKISLWDSSGQPVLTLDGGSEVLRALLWPQDNLLITAGNDGTAALWQLQPAAPAPSPQP